MPKEKLVREQDKFTLRLPDGMRGRLMLKAKANHRSLNTEIIARLEKSLDEDQSLAEVIEQVGRIEAMVIDHDQKLNPQNWG